MCVHAYLCVCAHVIINCYSSCWGVKPISPLLEVYLRLFWFIECRDDGHPGLQSSDPTGFDYSHFCTFIMLPLVTQPSCFQKSRSHGQGPNVREQKCSSGHPCWTPILPPHKVFPTSVRHPEHSNSSEPPENCTPCQPHNEQNCLAKPNQNHEGHHWWLFWVSKFWSGSLQNKRQLKQKIRKE